MTGCWRGSNSAEASGHTTRSTPSRRRRSRRPATARTSPGAARSKYPAGPLPCTDSMRIVPSSRSATRARRAPRRRAARRSRPASAAAGTPGARGATSASDTTTATQYTTTKRQAEHADVRGQVGERALATATGRRAPRRTRRTASCRRTTRVRSRVRRRRPGGPTRVRRSRAPRARPSGTRGRSRRCRGRRTRPRTARARTTGPGPGSARPTRWPGPERGTGDVPEPRGPARALAHRGEQHARQRRVGQEPPPGRREREREEHPADHRERERLRERQRREGAGPRTTPSDGRRAGPDAPHGPRGRWGGVPRTHDGLRNGHRASRQTAA